MITWQIFKPAETTPQKTILPTQTHSTNIIEIKTGKENLDNCDGIWTTSPDLLLGVKTADCAPIVFISKNKFGIIHCGWRGLVNGIIENALEIFDQKTDIFIGALYPRFEIQADACYQKIINKFGQKFTTKKENKIIFDFLAAIQSIIPQAKWSNDNTFQQSEFASWRRDREKTMRNITIVGKLNS